MHAATNFRARMLMKSLSSSSSLSLSSLFMLLSRIECMSAHKIYGVILFSVIFGYILNATIGFMEMSEGRYLNALNLQLKAASSPLLFVAKIFFVSLSFTFV